jgi:dihydroflavonol-4-reductase
MVLQGKFPLLPRGANIPLVDVRDLAQVLAVALEVETPDSYVVASYQPSLRAIVALLGDRTGRRIPNIPVPDTLARATGRIADAVQRLVTADLPIRGGSMRQITSMPRIDSTAASQALGFAPRPLEETLDDTVRWLLQAAHISRKQAGRLALDI